MRINKFLAESGIASRRQCDKLIEEGKVTVNGAPCTLGQEVTEKDSVKVEGVLVRPQEKKEYYMMNKPKGYVSTVKDDKDGSTKKALGKISLYVSIMSVCLFLNSFFKVMAAKTVDAAILYPCVQGIALLFSIGMSAVFFKEKLTLKCAIGTAMIFAGLLIINCL